jgi:uracil-DNA glycosylase
MCPDDPPGRARVIIVAQNPGLDEIQGRHFVRYTGPDAGGEIYESDVPRPMIGKTGYELDKHFLPLAGLQREQVECRNVVRCRLDDSNDLPPLTTTLAREMVRHCQRAYWKEPQDGQVIVALGAYALWALTGEYEGDEDDADSADADDVRAPRSIDGWRGWLLPYLPVHDEQHLHEQHLGASVRVFATYHPAFYWRAHWLKPVGRMDWARLGRVLKGTWPEPFPTINAYDPEPRLSLAFDTEYNRWTRELHRYSAAWRFNDDARVYVRQPDEPWCHVPEHIIMQNAEADWSYIKPIFGDLPLTWDDTMYMHGLLHGTLRHNLDFMGSCYARHNRWKHLQESDPEIYSGMDALATWDIYHALKRELAFDAESAALYNVELKPLLPIIMARPSVTLDSMHIVEAVRMLTHEQEEVGRKAQAVAGWPINIGSPDMVARWIRRKRESQEE